MNDLINREENDDTNDNQINNKKNNGRKKRKKENQQTKKLWKYLSFFCLLIPLIWSLLWSSWLLFAMIMNDVDISNHIGYQIHSWNDAREWPSALKKGANWWKLDLHFPFDNNQMNNRTVCQVQQNIPLLYRNDSRGCLLFSHDLPVASSNWYNTTYDLLDFLSNPRYRSYFMSKDGFYIALCAKMHVGNVCENTKAAKNWISLVDDFLIAANETITKHRLNVTFILDGSATSGGKRNCLQNRWNQYPSMYLLYLDDPIAISSYLGNGKRLVISNQPVIGKFPSLFIDVLAFLYYGKFRESNWPMINWEPDKQSIVLASARAYVNKGISAKGGFMYAINLDPIHFQVSIGSISKNAWNEKLPFKKSSQIPLIVATQNPFNQDIWIWTLHSDPKRVYLDGMSSSRMFDNLQKRLSFPLESLSNIVALDITEKDENNRFLWILDVSSRFQLYSINWSNNAIPIQKIREDFLRGSATSNGTLLGSRLTYLNGSFYAFNLESSSDGICSLQIRVWNISAPNSVSMGTPICISKLKGISRASFDVEWNDGNLRCGTSSWEWVSVISFSTESKLVYHAYSCFNESKNIVSTNSNPTNVGISSSISLLRKNSNIFVLSIQGDSFEYNTEEKNKDPDVAICDQIPVSQPKIMMYSYSPFQDLVNHLNSNGTWITSCHDSILHGSFDLGTNPSAFLFLHRNDQHELIPAMVEIHEGIESNDAVFSNHTYKGSGLPLSHSGLVLDSWKLPNLVEN